ncbi:hypothetical protein OAK16_01740 [Verrucomicrobia bacterium]|nr:hypothetical protein [Verrucomicrobiota bacterium]
MAAVPDSLIRIFPEKADPFLKWTTSPAASDADSAFICDFQGLLVERPSLLSDPFTESM